MIRYKVDVLAELKKVGYSTYRLRKENILGQATMQMLRVGGSKISVETVDTICTLLACQPGDLMEWVPNEEEVKHG